MQSKSNKEVQEMQALSPIVLPSTTVHATPRKTPAREATLRRQLLTPVRRESLAIFQELAEADSGTSFLSSDSPLSFGVDSSGSSNLCILPPFTPSPSASPLNFNQLEHSPLSPITPEQAADLPGRRINRQQRAVQAINYNHLTGIPAHSPNYSAPRRTMSHSPFGIYLDSKTNQSQSQQQQLQQQQLQQSQQQQQQPQLSIQSTEQIGHSGYSVKKETDHRKALRPMNGDQNISGGAKGPI